MKINRKFNDLRPDHEVEPQPDPAAGDQAQAAYEWLWIKIVAGAVFLFGLVMWLSSFVVNP